ncbi:MAG: hypothetical protein AAFY70_12395 [Bacteroidota bacterium]
MSFTLFEVQSNPKTQLKEHLRYLANEVFPEIAQRGDYVIVENHCLLRVVYDQLFQGKWQDHATGQGPLIHQLSETQLVEAIQLATQVISNKSVCDKMNEESLTWRG